MIKTFNICLFLFIFCSLLKPQCKSNNVVFTAGENIKYTVAYQLGFIWVNAGKAEFKTSLTRYKNKPAWYFESSGISNSKYDWFFKVRDSFTVYTDTSTFVPVWANRVSDEGGYIVLENYIFDNTKNIIISTVYASDKPEKTDTIDYKVCIKDLLTAVYYARSLDYSNRKINEKIPIWVLVFGKVYPLYIRYLGKEEIVLHNTLKYKCLKFSSKLVEGTIFKGGEDMFVWVTDDANHVAVKIQARIIVGSVIAEIDDYKGLLCPLKPIK